MRRQPDFCPITDGMSAAVAYKYYSQFINQYIERPVQLKMIRAKAQTFYRNHQQLLDKFAAFFAKHGIDAGKYMRFVTLDLRFFAKDIEEKLLSMDTINKYVENMQIKDKRQKVFKRLKTSAENIAAECVKLGYPRVVDWIRKMILERKLATWYVTGKISKYYFAMIPKFPLLVEKMDVISKSEFSYIVSKYEKYENDAREAMIQEDGEVLKVLSWTDDLIYEMKHARA